MTLREFQDSLSDCGAIKPLPSLKLFPATMPCIGKRDNTSFEPEPTEITTENAADFFQFDHTPILFKSGYCKGENFVYATVIPFDEDNSISDVPEDWVTPEAIASHLKELGINFWIVASRNHMLPKEKNGVAQAARPRFHVYLLLSEPLRDPDKFVRLCEWCIKTFNSDPQVKSKAQKMYGFGDNPHKFIKSWDEGKCIDEILTNDDLASFIKSVRQVKASTTLQSPITRTSQPQNNTMVNRIHFTIDHIKAAARGRGLDILEHVAGIPADLLDGKHHPCPACGGKDRFRMINADAGAVLCNQCFKEHCGDFIAAVQHYCNVELPEALALIAEYLHLEPVASVRVESIKNSKNNKSLEQKREEWDKMFGGALTASEIWTMDFGQLEWFVDGLITEGLTVLAGQSKIGKSWFVLQLAICIAIRRLFLNAFDTSEHEILYIALEDNRRRMQSRIKMLGLPVNSKLRIIHTWLDRWESLDYFLEKHPKMKVVIIDTWGRFVSGVCKDSNDYAETTALASHLHDLARKHKAAIIAVTHTKKGATAKDWIEDTIGSKGLPAVADTLLKLSRDRNSTVGALCITGRDVEEQEFTLEHGENWEWRLLEEHADSDLNDVQREVMTVLRRIGQPATARDVKRHSRMLQEIDKLDKDKVDGILETLWNLDKIERHFETGIGNRGAVRYKIKRHPLTIDVDTRPH